MIHKISISLVAILVSQLALAQEGSEESLFTPFPDATLVDSSLASSVESYDFLTGKPERIRRDVLLEGVRRVQGVVSTATYEIASSIRREDIWNHYERQFNELGGTIVFDCEGADCGRSQVWSSEVFERNDLSGRRENQQYAGLSLKREGAQVLVALYVVTRGNRRNMVHIEEIRLDEPVEFTVQQDIAYELEQSGFVVISGVTPDVEGNLTGDRLEAIGPNLAELRLLSTQRIYVLCHIYHPRSFLDLIETSIKCAESVATTIGDSTQAEIVPMGLGPLQPTPGRPSSRVELVVPSLLQEN